MAHPILECSAALVHRDKAEAAGAFRGKRAGRWALRIAAPGTAEQAVPTQVERETLVGEPNLRVEFAAEPTRADLAWKWADRREAFVMAAASTAALAARVVAAVARVAAGMLAAAAQRAARLAAPVGRLVAAAVRVAAGVALVVQFVRVGVVRVGVVRVGVVRVGVVRVGLGPAEVDRAWLAPGPLLPGPLWLARRGATQAGTNACRTPATNPAPVDRICRSSPTSPQPDEVSQVGSTQ